MADWCHMDEKAVLAELRSDKKGLTEAEAQKRLGMYGENVLKEKERPQWWQVFLAQFEDLLVIILIGAAAVSMLTGDPESALVIFSVLLLNAVLGTVQHQKAEKSLDSLRRLSSPEARVVREGPWPSPRPRWFPGIFWFWRPGTWCRRTGGFWRYTVSR